MQATDENIARLHQEASTHYLQGRFADALTAWRQILAANPQDERALEGVRLCELLLDDTAAAAEDSAPATESAAPPAEPVEAASVETIEIIDEIDLQIPNLETDLNAATSDPDHHTDGMDLGDVPETLSLAGDPPAIPEVELISDDVVEYDVAPVVETTEGATASELLTRVQNLLIEANVAHKNGDHETARTVLARVFILDEANVQALAMKKRIEDEELDLASDLPEKGTPAGTMPIDPALVVDDPTMEAPIEETWDGGVIVDPATDDDAGFDDPVAAAQPAATKRVNLPQLNLGGKTRWIVICAVLVGIAVVGAGFWMKLQSVKIRDEDPAPTPSANAAAPVEPRAGATQPAEPPKPAPAPVATGDVSTLLAQGRKAYEAADFAAAIVAYHGVIAQQPTNVEAIERMEAATEAYREQQAIREQWASATSLFEEGDYRSAMKMFYRLVADTDADRRRLERYKENGWFNMGVLALRASQCDEARTNLTEAQLIDPEDADISTALTICDSCDSKVRNSGFLRAAAAVPIRGLDD